jgi:hypothetical protein
MENPITRRDRQKMAFRRAFRLLSKGGLVVRLLLFLGVVAVLWFAVGQAEAVSQFVAGAAAVVTAVFLFFGLYCWYLYDIRNWLSKHKAMVLLFLGAGLVAAGIIIAGLGVIGHPDNLGKTHPSDIPAKLAAIDEARDLVDAQFNSSRAAFFKSMNGLQNALQGGANQFSIALEEAHRAFLEKIEAARLLSEKYRHFDGIAEALSDMPDKEVLPNAIGELRNAVRTGDGGVANPARDRLAKALEPFGAWQGKASRALLDLRRQLSR